MWSLNVDLSPLVFTVEFVWWWGGVGWVGGGVCTVIFVSTPSPTDLDWSVRLDWSLTKRLSRRIKMWDDDLN